MGLLSNYAQNVLTKQYRKYKTEKVRKNYFQSVFFSQNIAGMLAGYSEN